MNNPLSLTDPTGYSWLGDTFAAVVGIAVSIETFGSGILVSAALGGASSSLVSSMFNGANLWQTAKSTLKGGLWGAASGAMNFGIGSIKNAAMNILAHTVAEGAVEALQGGSFIHGAFVGGMSTVGNRYIDGMKGIKNSYKVTQNITYPTIIGLFFPRSYKHKFKIK